MPLLARHAVQMPKDRNFTQVPSARTSNVGNYKIHRDFNSCIRGSRNDYPRLGISPRTPPHPSQHDPHVLKVRLDHYRNLSTPQIIPMFHNLRHTLVIMCAEIRPTWIIPLHLQVRPHGLESNRSYLFYDDDKPAEKQ